jgi:hypothetical protein
LTRLAAPAIVEPPAPPPGGQAFAPTVRGPAAVYPGSFKTDSTEFVLGPYEFVEYKYHLEQGASMLYSWKATVPVIHEFHGDRDGTIDEPVSYDKRDTRGESGSFAAPFSGIHGWYWENPGAESVTISVASAGFYTSAIEFRSDNTRRPHSLDEPRGTTPPLTR